MHKRGKGTGRAMTMWDDSIVEVLGETWCSRLWGCKVRAESAKIGGECAMELAKRWSVPWKD